MIRGILFDKDGTLIDFDRVWVPASQKVITNCLSYYQCNIDEYIQRLMSLIGIRGGKTTPDSLLAQKSIAEIVDTILVYLKDIPKTGQIDEKKIRNVMIRDYHSFSKELTDHDSMICDLHMLFSRLRERGLILGIASQDDHTEIVDMAMRLGFFDQLAYIGGFGAVQQLKPDPEMAITFAKQNHLAVTEIAVVGDLPLDMQFAKNSHCTGIGVRTGLATEAELSPLADYVIESVDNLPECIEKIEQVSK